MHHRSYLIMRCAVAALLAVASFSAAAFFPYGTWNQNRRLVNITWPRSVMDVNNDGDITEGEGIPYYIEEGNLGFNEDEIRIVREAFDVWQNVPTAYVAFREVGRITSPRPGVDLDNLNTVSLAFPGEEEAGLVGGGILGVTAFTFAVEDGVVDGVNVTGGQLIEADIVIDAGAVRGEAPGVAPAFDLKSIMVHEIGHFLGLDHTPMNNLEDVGTDAAPFLVDPAVLALRDASGQLVRTGATPTMFPIYFKTEYDTGIASGAAILAPDDIAGVSFLYPRGSQHDRFSIAREVRDQASHVFPSAPIAGSHVIAWADTDNNPNTSRTPLISTMSALYADNQDVSVRGRFDLRGLPKQMESFGTTEPFFVTYTFTSSPIDGASYLRQAPPGFGPEDFDSTHIGDPGGRAYPLETIFYSETFHEQGNVFGIDKYSVGTPLVFDPVRQKPVSTITGLTLDSMLAGFRPMFGDPVNVCFLNVAAAGLKTTHGNDLLRGARDNWLRKTAVGTALVDGYYGMAPAVTRFLVAHPSGLRAARGAMWCVEQAIIHGRIFALLLVLALGGLLFRQRLQRKSAAMALLAAGALLALSVSAHGSTSLWYTDDLVSHSDTVISGHVTRMEVQLNSSGRPETHLTVHVTGKAMGEVNKDGVLVVKQLGGRIGNLVTYVAAYPRFREGENVVLFLFYRPDFGHYSVTGGQRGKLNVVRDARSGKEYVLGVEESLAEKLGAVKSTDGRTGVPVDQYLQYVRERAAEMEKQE